MKLSDLFSEPTEAGDILADYDYPDSEYLNAIGLKPTDDDSFDDLSAVFAGARGHGITPEMFANMLTDETGVYMIDPSKYATAVAILGELQTACGDFPKCTIKYWEIDRSLSVCAESEHIDIRGLSHVRSLERAIGIADSVSFDLTTAGTVRIDITISDAAKKCEVVE